MNSMDTPAAQTDGGSIAAPMVADLRNYFNSGATRSYEWRMQQLQRVVDFFDEKEEEIMEALYQDSGKAEFNCYSGDILLIRSEAIHTMRKLKKWMKPKRVGTPLYIHPAKSYVRPEPLGVVFIIGAWNFPVQLTIGPLVGAIAAGNTALIKPSEVSPAVSALLAKYVPEYFDNNAVKVIEGGVEETTDALAQRYDHVFYTGNSAVAKIVMAAAAKHLTPVTLELGGKNPCIVREDCNLDVSVRRLVEGKFANNAGQVCVSADYVYVHRSIYNAFMAKLGDTIRAFFGDKPEESSSWSRIINGRHLQRLKGLLEGQNIAFGGDIDEASNYMGPTVLTEVSHDAPVMQQEIFGPILPIFVYDELKEVTDYVASQEAPLAMYIFTEDRKVAQQLMDSCTSGGVTINGIMMQAGNANLPFGGVGNSGMGYYHGKHSFDNLVHHRAVVDKSTRVDPKGAYPPFPEEEMSTRKKVTKWLMSL